MVALYLGFRTQTVCFLISFLYEFSSEKQHEEHERSPDIEFWKHGKIAGTLFGGGIGIILCVFSHLGLLTEAAKMMGSIAFLVLQIFILVCLTAIAKWTKSSGNFHHIGELGSLGLFLIGIAIGNIMQFLYDYYENNEDMVQCAADIFDLTNTAYQFFAIAKIACRVNIKVMGSLPAKKIVWCGMGLLIMQNFIDGVSNIFDTWRAYPVDQTLTSFVMACFIDFRLHAVGLWLYIVRNAESINPKTAPIPLQEVIAGQVGEKSPILPKNG
jgi:hypothetical protein